VDARGCLWQEREAAMDRPHVAASVCVNSRNCEHFVSVTRKSSEAIRQIFTKKSVTHTVPGTLRHEFLYASSSQFHGIPKKVPKFNQIPNKNSTAAATRFLVGLCKTAVSLFFK